MLRVWVQDVGFYAGNHTAKSYIALIESLLLNFFFLGGGIGVLWALLSGPLFVARDVNVQIWAAAGLREGQQCTLNPKP